VEQQIKSSGVYPEFAKKQNRALFKVPYNQYTKIDCLIAQTK
jgi:hypothetical protein